MNRRDLMKTALLGAGMLPMQGALAAASERGKQPRRSFLLVHGAWHNALHWARLTEALSARGHQVVAINLPGHGLNARFPSAYVTGDAAKLLEERSPQADLTLEDCAVAVVTALEKLRQGAGGTKPVLVGHSVGGAVITRAGELAPQHIGRLVYLSAYCPLRLGSPSGYNELPEARTGYGETLFLGDPGKLGAVRINPRGGTDYLEALREAYYQDVPLADFLPFALSLTPDLPLSLWTAKVGATPARWGRIPRSYLRCTQDRALAPALQALMIREANAFTPGNAFTVESLEASHSPFASQPEALAALLDGLR
ncbi:alpha/beta fold hydrolase [Myxococcus llanfairpwllgwyngyllgogerychwyrndrobwllllantysiliogogogochensis]|uniref:Alpha/beta fold hydrolase n=1 Tax=Myxococcus llanfairpwllgwyngyllgogerychwyrndrobwllllantysiliogogogochensis TaxID=2590453 RepID=A0A540X9K1_9BACT|nr:alpha/beta fold hydrolase [Myxococcus llanfairpwllgwyngyllgogerychwyrndrobwllllantysiliogogogochensis]TQF17973.1 alpha/beta fold hydrolase [Myxococcus llanfairpwllgwyngyllgogerychwyrndrobwllllantysiliogogogochensis]